MTTDLQTVDAGAAAELIGFGLQPRLRPAGSASYADLVARHQSDVGFRDLVEHIADGLGLVVLEVDGVSGVVLAPAPGSPFELRLVDYRANLSADDRLLHGLIHLGIAAYAFPTPATLGDDSVRHASVLGVERFLRTACERLRDQDRDRERNRGRDVGRDRSRPNGHNGYRDREHADTDAGTGAHADAARDTELTETEQAWRLYLRRQPSRDTADGRVGVSTTTGMIKYALERLVAAGMASRAGSDDGGTYRLLRRYRTGVRELGATAAYRELMEAMHDDD